MSFTAEKRTGMTYGLSLKGCLSICRITNLPSVWSNVLCAYLLAAGSFSWTGYLLPATAISCLYLGGMCLNDFCDLTRDSLARPWRPIPSGLVSQREALLLAASLMAAGSLSLLFGRHLQGFVASLPLVGVIVWYDLDHKENPYSVLLMATCRFFIFVVTAISVSGDLTGWVLLAGAVHFSYIVCLSLVARYEGNRQIPFSVPVIPLMLAAICLLDGIIMAILVDSWWLLAGIAGALLMQEGQKYLRGD
jgi:4-hydroxybenzoate polyprenyltransferase